MIPAELQSQLRQRFNPDGSTLRRHQLRMLEMLKYVDELCSRHHIRYWLSSGTCLGAIRHGGFIPWDDDVDIEMLATDYLKLKAAVAADPQSPISWHDSDNDPNFFFPYAKLRDPDSLLVEKTSWNHYYNQRGIYIDVFRLYPSGMKRVDAFANWYHHRFVLGVAKRRESWAGRLALRPCVWLMNRIIAPMAQRLTAINAGGQLRHHVGSEYMGPRHVDDVKETVRVSFEGLMLPVPKGYDSYLRKLFGDYMALPDLDKVNPHSSNITFLQ